MHIQTIVLKEHRLESLLLVGVLVGVFVRALLEVLVRVVVGVVVGVLEGTQEWNSHCQNVLCQWYCSCLVTNVSKKKVL